VWRVGTCERGQVGAEALLLLMVVVGLTAIIAGYYLSMGHSGSRAVVDVGSAESSAAVGVGQDASRWL
jgi:uncharacterized protein (UPF0333 family)